MRLDGKVAIVTASTTVGIPIASTGIPKVFIDSSPLLLPTPLPGNIPESVNWIVLFTLSIELEARASIIIVKSQSGDIGVYTLTKYKSNFINIIIYIFLSLTTILSATGCYLMKNKLKKINPDLKNKNKKNKVNIDNK